MVEQGIGSINWEKAAQIFAPERLSWQKQLKKGLEKYPLAKDLLLILAAGGAVSLALLAPEIGTVIAKEIKWRERSKFNQRLARLKKRKLVTITYPHGEPLVEITEDGFKKALEYKFTEMKIREPDKWDGKWRLVIFDVHNIKKHRRDNLR